MSVIITPIDFVRKQIVNKYPTCVELGGFTSVDSTMNIYASIKDAKRMLDSGAIPIAKSALHVGNLASFTKYMVIFDNPDQLRELLAKEYDSEEYIEHQINLYIYERLSFLGHFKPIKFNDLHHHIVEKMLSHKEYNTPLRCCGRFRTKMVYFKNKYDTAIDHTHHGDFTLEFSDRIGLIYDNSSGEVLAPAVHLGNGYMLIRTFLCNYDYWTTRTVLVFNGYQFNLGHFNLEPDLSDEDRGLTVIRVYMPFTMSQSCKIKVRTVEDEPTLTLDVGFNEKGNVKIVYKNGCSTDLTWFDNFVVLDDNGALIGFKTYREMLYIDGSMQNRILRKMFTHTMFQKNMPDDLTVRYA